jgi:HK97 family phage major capsid protein
MSNVIESKRILTELATKAREIVAEKSYSNTAKQSMLGALEAELKTHQDVIAMHQEASRLMVGASSIDSGESYSFGRKALGTAPKLNLSMSEIKSFHQAAVSRQSYRVEAKSTDFGASIPALLLPGVVSKLHEPTRILDYIPTTAIGSPSIEFLTHASTTGSAGMVARGAAKPESTLNITPTILTARKIAVHSAAPDEILKDFEAFIGYLTLELERQIADVENAQVLSGSGIGENITGILTTSGILTRAKATDTGLDAFEQAIKDLRVGSSYCKPSLIVAHPTDFSALRRSKDTQGRYLLNANPSEDEAQSLWGIPVLTTTQIAAGTSLIGNFEIGAEAFIREGFTLTMSNSSGADFTSNLTRWVAEERITLGVSRPSAFITVTGL